MNLRVPDVEKFWAALLGGGLITSEMVRRMLSIQSQNVEDDAYYGYGLWIDKGEDGSQLPFFQGGDPGVSFVSSYDTIKKLGITVVSNYGDNVWKLWRKIRSECA